MQATPEHLTMLSELLTQSLSPNPEIRHPAEKTLDSSELQSGFLFLVMTLVASDAAAMHVRQAAGVYFKNVIKKRWTEVSKAAFNPQSSHQGLIHVFRFVILVLAGE